MITDLFGTSELRERARAGARRVTRRARSSSPERGAVGRGVLPAARMLEVGIIATLGVVAAAVGAYVLSDVLGRARRSRRNRKPRPAPGSVPAARHQNIAVASPR